MLETRQTNRFALLFFLFFIGVTLGLAFFPPFYSLSYAEQSMLDYVLAFLPPICFYFLFTKFELLRVGIQLTLMCPLLFTQI